MEEKTKDLIEAQAELERTNRLSDIGLLATTVAHELQNPLSTISTIVYNIKRKFKTSDLCEHLDNIEKKLAESNSIIDNLLFYSHLRPPQFEMMNIFNTIEARIADMEMRNQKEITMIKNIDSIKDVLIQVDQRQIKEMFYNIFSNAYFAVPDKEGKIIIKAENEPEFIKVIVEDNGKGILKENLDKVFDPFFTTKAKGSGLGLSICQKIIKMHDGEISIKSGLRQGTTVTVSLQKKGKINGKGAGS